MNERMSEKILNRRASIKVYFEIYTTRGMKEAKWLCASRYIGPYIGRSTEQVT